MALGSAAVIGAGGFIGQNVAARLRRDGVAVAEIGRDTPREQWPAEVDAVFFCAGNSAAYLTRREPAFCLQRNVCDLDAYLLGLKYRRWIHLSSMSVYPLDLADKREDAVIDINDVGLYGAHKYMSERHVREFASDWVMVRPGSLFGTGLKKNLFFDLRAGAKDIFLTRDSRLSALNVADLADACVVLAEKAGREVVNVASRHLVTIGEITAMVPRDYAFKDERRIDEGGVALDVLNKYWSEPLDRQGHLAAIGRFIAGS